MKYGQRLRIARQHAGLTQKELVEKTGNICSQENISKLERADATGSEYTAQFAHACGVRAMWLASGSGPMLDAPYNEAILAALGNAKIMKAVALMESLPDYAVDITIQSLAGTQKLLHDAESGKVPKKKAEGEN